jgi:hypothetical protein
VVGCPGKTCTAARVKKLMEAVFNPGEELEA